VGKLVNYFGALSLSLIVGLNPVNAALKKHTDNAHPKKLVYHSSNNPYMLHSFNDDEKGKYVDRSIDPVLSEQTDIFGIVHSTRPSIFAYEDSCTTILGSYSGNFVIKINENKFTNKVRKSVLSHETAHLNTDILGKIIEVDVMKLYRDNDAKIALGMQLVCEGIAQYIEVKKGYAKPLEIKWPEDPLYLYLLSEVSSINLDNSGNINDYKYWGGYAVVKPIIDKYHVEGIEHLLKNPPSTTEELTKPMELYVKRIMSELETLSFSSR
jgi:hypothetical protein